MDVETGKHFFKIKFFLMFSRLKSDDENVDVFRVQTDYISQTVSENEPSELNSNGVFPTQSKSRVTTVVSTNYI